MKNIRLILTTLVFVLSACVAPAIAEDTGPCLKTDVACIQTYRQQIASAQPTTGGFSPVETQAPPAGDIILTIPAAPSEIPIASGTPTAVPTYSESTATPQGTSGPGVLVEEGNTTPQAVPTKVPVGAEIAPGLIVTGEPVVENGETWYPVYDEPGNIEDHHAYNPRTGQFARVEGIGKNNADRFLAAAQLSFLFNGEKPESVRSKVYLTTIGGQRAVVMPFAGESAESLSNKKLLTEEQKLALTWVMRDYLVELFTTTGLAVDGAEAHIFSTLVSPQYPKGVFFADLEFVWLPGESSLQFDGTADGYLRYLNDKVIANLGWVMPQIRIAEAPAYPYSLGRFDR